MKQLSLILIGFALLITTSFVVYAIDNPAESGVSQATLASTNYDAIWAEKVMGGTNVVEYNTTTTARSVLAYETGTVFVMYETSNDPTTFTLPTAEAGLTFTFIDNDATAAADLCIEPASGDQINKAAAGVSLTDTGDATGESVTLIAKDATHWVVMDKSGTWAAGN